MSDNRTSHSTGGGGLFKFRRKPQQHSSDNSKKNASQFSNLNNSTLTKNNRLEISSPIMFRNRMCIRPPTVSMVPVQNVPLPPTPRHIFRNVNNPFSSSPNCSSGPMFTLTKLQAFEEEFEQPDANINFDNTTTSVEIDQIASDARANEINDLDEEKNTTKNEEQIHVRDISTKPNETITKQSDNPKGLAEESTKTQLRKTPETKLLKRTISIRNHNYVNVVTTIVEAPIDYEPEENEKEITVEAATAALNDKDENNPPVQLVRINTKSYKPKKTNESEDVATTAYNKAPTRNRSNSTTQLPSSRDASEPYDFASLTKTLTLQLNNPKSDLHEDVLSKFELASKTANKREALPDKNKHKAKHGLPCPKFLTSRSVPNSPVSDLFPSQPPPKQPIITTTSTPSSPAVAISSPLTPVSFSNPFSKQFQDTASPKPDTITSIPQLSCRRPSANAFKTIENLAPIQANNASIAITPEIPKKSPVPRPSLKGLDKIFNERLFNQGPTTQNDIKQQDTLQKIRNQDAFNDIDQEEDQIQDDKYCIPKDIIDTSNATASTPLSLRKLTINSLESISPSSHDDSSRPLLFSMRFSSSTSSLVPTYSSSSPITDSECNSDFIIPPSPSSGLGSARAESPSSVVHLSFSYNQPEHGLSFNSSTKINSTQASILSENSESGTIITTTTETPDNRTEYNYISNDANDIGPPTGASFTEINFNVDYHDRTITRKFETTEQFDSMNQHPKQKSSTFDDAASIKTSISSVSATSCYSPMNSPNSVKSSDSNITSIPPPSFPGFGTEATSKFSRKNPPPPLKLRPSKISGRYNIEPLFSSAHEKELPLNPDPEAIENQPSIDSILSHTNQASYTNNTKGDLKHTTSSGSNSNSESSNVSRSSSNTSNNTAASTVSSPKVVEKPSRNTSIHPPLLSHSLHLTSLMNENSNETASEFDDSLAPISSKAFTFDTPLYSPMFTPATTTEEFSSSKNGSPFSQPSANLKFSSPNPSMLVNNNSFKNESPLQNIMLNQFSTAATFSAPQTPVTSEQSVSLPETKLASPCYKKQSPPGSPGVSKDNKPPTDTNINPFSQARKINGVPFSKFTKPLTFKNDNNSSFDFLNNSSDETIAKLSQQSEHQDNANHYNITNNESSSTKEDCNTPRTFQKHTETSIEKPIPSDAVSIVPIISSKWNQIPNKNRQFNFSSTSKGNNESLSPSPLLKGPGIKAITKPENRTPNEFIRSSFDISPKSSVSSESIIGTQRQQKQQQFAKPNNPNFKNFLQAKINQEPEVRFSRIYDYELDFVESYI